MNKRIWLAVALLVPIVALALTAYLKSMQRASGEEVVLPIEGFDPRDLLSGHYLIYRIDYGLEQGCSEHNVPAGKDAEEQARITGCSEHNVPADKDAEEQARITDCSEHNVRASICLRPQRGLYPQGSLPDDCTLFIKGRCDDSAEFMAGIERFYIPEEFAQVLEHKVRNKRGEVVLSVDHQGNAVIRDLLLDGKPWKQAINGMD